MRDNLIQRKAREEAEWEKAYPSEPATASSSTIFSEAVTTSSSRTWTPNTTHDSPRIRRFLQGGDHSRGQRVSAQTDLQFFFKIPVFMDETEGFDHPHGRLQNVIKDVVTRRNSEVDDASRSLQLEAGVQAEQATTSQEPPVSITPSLETSLIAGFLLRRWHPM
ncbi:unnamed protein product, partial [Amoebophrya sp. A25]|eukprot:GSA25T00020648001.1